MKKLLTLASLSAVALLVGCEKQSPAPAPAPMAAPAPAPTPAPPPAAEQPAQPAAPAGGEMKKDEKK